MPKARTYQDNFIAAVKHLMAAAELDTLKDVAAHLGIAYMTLYKIMDRSRSPTIEQCIILCDKAGYSANWLLLNTGEMHLSKQASLDSLSKEIKALSKKVDAQGV